MITITGGQKVIEFCDKYSSLRDRVETFQRRLGEYGISIAKVLLENAEYDGTNDCQITWEQEGNLLRITMSGASASFIEFGTGVTYVDNHPKAKEFGAIRGGYGLGLGKNPKGWYYNGEPGSHGLRMSKHGSHHTLGNPANRVMYLSAKNMRIEIERIAREVFGND